MVNVKFHTVILIVNWNGSRYVIDCIKSIHLPDGVKIILVDNASTDNSVALINEQCDNLVRRGLLKIIINKKNSGFAEGNNIGIREAFKDANIKYIITLNNDVVIERHFVKEIIRFSNKGYDMISSKTLFTNRSINTLGLKKNICGLFEDITSLHQREEIVCPSAVAALYSRRLLEQIKYKQEYFDKDFFMYNEDADLGLRARQLGFKCGCCLKAIAFHKYSMSTQHNIAFRKYYGQRNNLLLIIKNFSIIKLIMLSPIIFSCQLLTVLSNIFQGYGLVVFKAKIDALKLFPKIWKKRR